jgi:hypothetical protein
VIGDGGLADVYKGGIGVKISSIKGGLSLTTEALRYSLLAVRFYIVKLKTFCLKDYKTVTELVITREYSSLVNNPLYLR